jgi:hypothetical protein
VAAVRAPLRAVRRNPLEKHAGPADTSFHRHRHRRLSPQAKEHFMTTNARQLTRLTVIAAVLAAGFTMQPAQAAEKEVRVVQLQPVVVVGKRIRVIELERVVVVAKRLTPAATLVAQRGQRAERG